MLNFPRLRMNIPGTWEVFSADGRHAAVACSETPYVDVRRHLDHLNEREPEGGWTYEYIPIATETRGE